METVQEKALAAFGAKGIDDPAHVRGVIRRGGWAMHTSGVAEGRVQGNLVILPEALANDFLRYCQRNPKPCPVLAVSEVGQTALPSLGADIDIRTDLPMYRIWQHGELMHEVADRLCCTSRKADEITPAPDAAMPWHPRAPWSGARVA